MTIGIIGLGKMGQQIVVRLIAAGHTVVATDVDAASRQTAAAAGSTVAADRAGLVKQLGERPVVWLMIPSQYVEDELAALFKLLPAGSVVVDGGNSDFRETVRRGGLAQAAQVELVDAGTSGGILGERDGFAIMVGGSKAAVGAVQPAFEALAQPDGWAHFGPTGSGHFIKMVHNGIEYGLMEAYAEGYRLLREGHEFGELNLGEVARVWQHGSIVASTLNELTGQILTHNPTLEGIDGYVAESGEARWTLEVAAAQQIETPVIQAAFDVRLASQKGGTHFGTQLLAAMRNAFGGHKIGK